MRDMGMNKIIFDKDNTLCDDHHAKFYNTSVKNSFSKAIQTFGKENVLVVSNMSGIRYD